MHDYQRPAITEPQHTNDVPAEPAAPPDIEALLQQSLINQREILTWQKRTAVEMREWNNRKRIDVKIQDANIPFWHLVGLMLKVTIAAIPAMLIFGACILVFNLTILGGLLSGLR